MQTYQPIGFFRFYLLELWRAPSGLMKAIIRVEELLAVAVFAMWLVNSQLGEGAWDWLKDQSVWWFVGAIALAFVHHFLVANHAAFSQLHRRVWKIERKVLDKSATLRLARDLEETSQMTPAVEIQRLRKRIHYAQASPTVEQVEDVKRRWICYIKNDRDMLIGTPEEAAFGYQDNSEEMMSILELDASDISGSLNALWDDASRFSSRKYSAIEALRASAAAIATTSSSD